MSSKSPPLHIGGHYGRDNNESILDCLKKNTKIGGDVFQTFLGHHYKTTLRYKTILLPSQISSIRDYLKKNKIEFAIHSLLTLNFCNPTLGEEHHARYHWTIENVVYDIITGKKLYKATGKNPLLIVIHLGSTESQHYKITEEECRGRYIKNLIDILKQAEKIERGVTKNVKLLIETNAGEGNKIGKTIDTLAKLWKKVPTKYKSNLGFCIDTAHIFSAGYPIHTVTGVQDFIKEWNRKIGLSNIKMIHLNDSLAPFNQHRDIHKHIGEGYIYSSKKGGNINALIPLAQLAARRKIPIILETREENRYKEEIKMLRKIAVKYKRITKSKLKGGARSGAMNKKDYKERIIEIFRELARFHDSLSKKTHNVGSVYRVKSYTTIIKALQKINKPIYSIDDVIGIEGIGKSSLEKIEEIIKTNDLKMYREIQKDPHYLAMRELQNITGIGPETADKLISEGINTVEKLRKSWNSGKIELTHTQEIGLKYYEDLQKRIPRYEITKLLSTITKLIKNNISMPKGEGIRLTMAGSYRMGKKDSGDMDIIMTLTGKVGKTIDSEKFAMNSKYNAIFDSIIQLLKDRDIITDQFWKGRVNWMGIMKSNSKSPARHVDIRWIPERYEETFLLFFGSGEIFSRMIRKVAKEQGYTLNEWGLYDLKKGKYLEIYTERGIFAKLGLKYILPKNR
jgi:DNA polymerase beta